MTIAAYLRVSTAQQAQNETIESQRHALESYFTQHGIKEVRYFEDTGVSGGTDIHTRPAGGQLYKLILQAEVEKIYVFDQSRLSRDTADYTQFLKMAEAYGVAIVGVSDGLNTADERMQLTREMKVVMDAEYKRDATRRTRSGLRRRLDSGQISTRPPFGYAVEKGKLVIDETKASVVRRMYTEMATGKRTKDIVEALNAEGVPSPTNSAEGKLRYGGDGHWRHDTFRYTLKNRVYKGEFVACRTPIKKKVNGRKITIKRSENEQVVIQCPAIVSPELWQAAQDQIARNHRMRSGRLKEDFSLRGLVKCGTCGMAYTAQTVMGRRYKKANGDISTYKTFRYYGCGSTSSRDYTPCGNDRVNADVIEKSVDSILGEIVTSPEIIEKYVLALQNPADVSAIPARLKKARRQLEHNTAAREKAVSNLNRGLINEDDYRTDRAKLDTEQAQLKNEIDTLCRQSSGDKELKGKIVAAVAVLRQLRGAGTAFADLPPALQSQARRMIASVTVLNKTSFHTELIVPLSAKELSGSSFSKSALALKKSLRKK